MTRLTVPETIALLVPELEAQGLPPHAAREAAINILITIDGVSDLLPSKRAMRLLKVGIRIQRLIKEGVEPMEIRLRLGMSRATIYRHLPGGKYWERAA